MEVQAAGASTREAATTAIVAALQTTGFFRIVNHGLPAELMARALELSRDFFRKPYEEKLQWRPVEGSDAPLPAGYNRQPEASADKNEYLLMCHPEKGFNVYPAHPPVFRQVLEALYGELAKLASLLEEIVSECMGLPPSFLRDYNGDTISDFMVAIRYFPASADGEDVSGTRPHRDGTLLTLVFQDGVGGLEVLMDGEWVAVAPEEGTIIVNIGEILQVLSNNSFKTALHRVVRKSVDRHSYALHHAVDSGRWVEPVAQFTVEAGEKPRYRGFFYGEYLQQRLRKKTHPCPARNMEDIIDISHYAI